MAIASFARNYLISGLEGTPDVLDGLLLTLSSNEPTWDFRPDPERFTLREIVAHLADFEPLFRGRLERIRNEAEPLLPVYDEDQLAIDHDYAHSDSHQNLTLFRRERVTTISLLRSLKEEDWNRIGVHAAHGPLTLESILVFLAGHDGYHTRQVAQWLAESRR